MKKIVKILLTLMLLVSFNSCSDSNNVADDVLNDFQVGGIIRTLEIISNTMNNSVPDSFFSVMVEYQDEADGALLASMDVYVSIRDLTTGNGLTVANDMFIKSYDVSEFDFNTLHGLPRITILATYAEAEAALGVNPSGVSGGDLFVFELRANLTDGRVFGGDSGTGILSGGYFSSPFFYNALILCAPQDGDYLIHLVDNYGDGWQGSEVQAVNDGVPVGVSIPSYWDDPVGSVGDPQWSDITAVITIPVGTAETVWNYVAGDFPSECEFEIFGPDGASLGYFGPSPSPGLLPVALCKAN